MKIYKYPMTGSFTELEIPSGAQILNVHDQLGTPCIWMAVDPKQPITLRRFMAVPTGENVPERAVYLGTVHMTGGLLVFHIYEIVTKQ